MMVLYSRLLFSLLFIYIEIYGFYNRKPFSFLNHYSLLYSVDNNNLNRVDYSIDPFESFSIFDKILFNRFSIAVATEINTNAIDIEPLPTNYNTLIKMINKLTFSRNVLKVNEQSKSMLIRLFPSGLLPSYKFLFSRFKYFSAWMNTWVTHYTTIWLMGPSKVEDLVVGNEVFKDNCLLIEKCRFLETSGCVQTCLHACKIPTQRFFYEEMGLPVTLKPNFTDYSCRFEFGNTPIPLENDKSIQVPCLQNCINNKNKQICN